MARPQCKHWELAPHSSWVYAYGLTCDDKLLIQYWRGGEVTRIGQKGSYHYFRTGGVPGVCCQYVGDRGPQFFELLQLWASKGRFVWRILPYKHPYTIVQPPALPCGCDRSCGGCGPLPTTLHATASGGSVVLTWIPALQMWQGTGDTGECADPPPGNTHIWFRCDPGGSGNFQATLFCASSGPAWVNPDTFNCAPLNWTKAALALVITQ